MMLSNIIQASTKYKQNNGIRNQHSVSSTHQNTISPSSTIRNHTQAPNDIIILPELVSPITTISERGSSNTSSNQHTTTTTETIDEVEYMCCHCCKMPNIHLNLPSRPQIHINTQQRFIVIGMFIFEFYKIVMGTFLTIFVPQQCDYGTCKIYDNLFRNSIFHIVANFCNTITFITVCNLYWIELKRENWAIEYLEIDEGKPFCNLIDEVENYPFVRDDMNKINKNYLKHVYITIFVASINFIISAFSIYENYAGLNTITSFITFLVLIGIKFSNAYEVANESNEFSAVLSAYMKAPRIFNTIDERYKMTDMNVRDEDDMSYQEKYEREKNEFNDLSLENTVGIENIE